MKRFLGFLALIVFLAGFPAFYPRGCAETPVTEKPERSENAADTAGTASPAEPETEPAGEAVLVHDYKAFSIGFQGLSMDEVYGNVLQFSFTNQMDEPLMISVDYLLMDGVMVEPFFADRIEPGETRTSQIVVESTAQYMKNWELTEVVVDLWVYLPEKLYEGDLFHDEVRFLPKGESGARKWQREKRESDILLLDNSFVRMQVVNAERGNGNDLRLILFTEGKNDRDLLVRIERIWLNGKAFETYYAGKCKGISSAFSSVVIPGGLMELIGRPGMNQLRMAIEYMERDGQKVRTLKRETVTFSM